MEGGAARAVERQEYSAQPGLKGVPIWQFERPLCKPTVCLATIFRNRLGDSARPLPAFGFGPAV